MPKVRRQRLTIVSLILLVSGLAVGLALYALKQNINLFFTPTQVANHQVPFNTTFRMGGIVQTGSIHFTKGLSVNFVVSDHKNSVVVFYTGVLPDLFKAGQGIVVEGQLEKNIGFVADQVLAKHGADYNPVAPSS